MRGDRPDCLDFVMARPPPRRGFRACVLGAPARRRVCCFRVAASARPRDRPRGSMQAALEVAARHCRSETERYGRCVAASPSTWQRDCHQLKLSMARCTSAHPIVQKIRRDCAEPFTAFEQCLKQNEASVVNCTEHVEQFLLCAEQVKLVTKGDTENFRLQE